MDKKTKQLYIVITVGVFCLLVGFLLGKTFAFKKAPMDNVPLVSTFAECAAKGYPVRESYPAQCSTPDGKTFVQEISQSPDPEEDQVSCTADALECPNGIFVGRIGPKCEFAPCPSM